MRFFLAFIISTLLLSSAVEGMKFFDELEEQFCKTTNGENPNDSMCVISGAISKSACLEACEGGVSGHNCDFQDDDVTACEWVEGWGCKLYIEPMEPVGTPYPDHSCWVRKHAVTLMHQGTQCDDRSDALGTGLSPEQCAAVVHEAGCETGVFMYSGYSYHYTWGCRCCHSTDGLTGNGNWDVYQIGGSVCGERENGFCVKSSGADQNSGVVKFAGSDYWSEAQCLQECNSLSGVGITGCELIWNQYNRGCYYHTAEVSHGNGRNNHYCWTCEEQQYGGRRLHSVGASVASSGNNRLLLENSKL